MCDLFFSQKMTRFSAPFLMATVIAVLAGCSANTTGTSTGGTTPPPVVPPVPAPSLTVALVSNSISTGTSTIVNATVKDAAGAAVPFIVVTFSTDPAMGTMTPSNGTALTDASGVASITLIGGATLGATTIKATAQVGTTVVTGSSGYTVGAVAVIISPPVFGANPLSAFGTTSVTVTVSGGGAGALIVNFSSVCSSTGKAFLSTGIATVPAVPATVPPTQTATASYRDNGCAATDTIIATISGGLATNNATLVVTPPTTGSIQYVSSVPSNISLKGTGGIEVSNVTFKVLDTGGSPLSGKLVTFGLTTTLGGITLTPNTGVPPFATSTATSGSDGTVVAHVNSGTFSTPVRVNATTTGAGGVILTTQSSQLTITTGIPDQFGFSLAATQWNIEGWTVDGTTSVLTVRLADHFKNPVPDNTAVNFTAQAGKVAGSCTTVDSGCTVLYTSQGTRPLNGRVALLAYAVGEETFTDLNGNGWADVALVAPVTKNEMIDPNGKSTDMPEAFVDYKEDGIFDKTVEPYIDFNGDGVYTAADNKFSGVLCDDINTGRSSAGSCATSHLINVRQNAEMVLSSSVANITINGGIDPIVVPPCDDGTAPLPAHIPLGNVPATFIVTVVDVNGNAMPAGTTVAFTTDNGIISSAPIYIVPSTSACRSSYSGCPSSAGLATFGDIPVTMKSDAIFDTGASPICKNTNPSGTFTVTVTTPSNPAIPTQTKTIMTATVTD
jgi:hypothetical protein